MAKVRENSDGSRWSGSFDVRESGTDSDTTVGDFNGELRSRNFQAKVLSYYTRAVVNAPRRRTHISPCLVSSHAPFVRQGFKGSQRT